MIVDYLPFLHIGRQAIRNGQGRVLEANSDSKGMYLKLNTESGAFKVLFYTRYLFYLISLYEFSKQT